MNPAAVLLSSSLPRSVYRPDYASSKSWQFIQSLSKGCTLHHLCINEQKRKVATASSIFIKAQKEDIV